VDFLQTIDTSNPALLALGCACLCGVGLIFMIVFQVVGGFLEAIVSFFELIFGLLGGGGSVSGCGCLFLLAACVGTVVVALLVTQMLTTCGTPQAVNFCGLFGR
jgi:hypothetical protein